jgi:predicted SprT family Zn-dependent metalloprotease
MMDKKKIRYPCKCNRADPEHTVEENEDGWTRYVCSSCGKVKFVWRGGAVKNPKEKGL